MDGGDRIYLLYRWLVEIVGYIMELTKLEMLSTKQGGGSLDVGYWTWT